MRAFGEQEFLYATAPLEVGARGSVLTVSREATERGYEVIQWDMQGRPEEVGHVAVYDEDVFPAFQNLETLLRAIEPLAQVLDAAGAVIVELLGRRLSRPRSDSSLDPMLVPALERRTGRR